MVAEITNGFGRDQIKLMHLLCGDHYPMINSFVNAWNEVRPDVKLSGGVAGDILNPTIRGYVFTEEGVIDNGIVTACLMNENLHIFSEVETAHEAISPVFKIDTIEGSYIGTIDGKNAVDWCREQLGMEDPTQRKNYEDWQLVVENDALIKFPMILEHHNGASRYIKYDFESKKMSLYFSTLPNETELDRKSVV